LKKRIFILDTNVLMHDPSALYRFEEHDLFIPMVVLEELDAAKKGTSEVSRNARQVSRFLDDLMRDKDHTKIEQGLPLPSGTQAGIKDGKPASGRLFFQTRPSDASLPDVLPGNKPDNSILITALALRTQHPDRRITLVSKDINLRIKAAIVGVHTEDYQNDQVLDDLDLLPTGYATLPREGMRAIPRQLAAALPAGSVRTGARVRAVTNGRVELTSGEELSARAVVLATDAQQAASLVPGHRAPSWSGCATLYFAAAASPLESPLLMLNAERGRGPVNHVCVPSDVQPSYAPAGQALISATVINPSGADDAALDRAARAQLGEWFGPDVVRAWRTLRVTRVPHSLPRSVPRPEGRDAAVRLGPGLVACGDYLETPSINGALRSGRRAAEAVLAEFGLRTVSAA